MEEKIYSKKILEMITVANEFCLFLEGAGEYSFDEITNYLQKVSPLLYLKGSLLPEMESENQELNERFVTEDQWTIVFSILSKKFGESNSYYFVGDVKDGAMDPLKGNIAENYADVYQDLKDFVLLFQKNSRAAQENAVCSVKNLFDANWGEKLLLSLKAIHQMRNKDRFKEGHA